MVALDRGAKSRTADQDLDELSGLCMTAGVDVTGRITQARRLPDVATFIGKGKVEEVRLLLEETGADVAVFDDPLSPAQARNLEKALGLGPGGEPRICVLDRAQLILDIFARRARSLEGKLQVELAQLEYLLPRLTRHWSHLSRQRGGAVGTRGPGETQLEVDRRRVRERAARLRTRLGEVRRTRELHRKDRAAVPFPTVALVGYTNAGKSSLMNALTGASVVADARLFATLDPTLRRLELPGSGPILLSDTVGFIHKLPHALVDAFRSTLEEVCNADLLLHITDAADPDREHHRRVVVEVLGEIGAADRPRLEVWNKIDCLQGDERLALAAVARRENAVLVSAQENLRLAELVEMVATALGSSQREERFVIPHACSELIALIERGGAILGFDESPQGYEVLARIDPRLAGRIRKRLAEAAAAPGVTC